MNQEILLTSVQMAQFVARGFLRFDAAVPADINEQFMAEAGQVDAPKPGEKFTRAYGKLLATNELPEVAAGTSLNAAYAQGSAIARILQLPLVRGALRSLLGEDPIFDHHFLHITFPPSYHAAANTSNVSQHTHQDSTIDPRMAFDVQVMYYPHEVTRAMGGTRFVPGTHLRKVSEVALGRYQNIKGQQHMVCPAGTLLFLHHGMWHGGGVNHSDRTRMMFKIRINPSAPQVRCWDLRDLPSLETQRPIFYRKNFDDVNSVESILMAPEPWFEMDTGRLEYIHRIKLWRYLTGDPKADIDYWLTRVENLAHIQ